MLKKISLSILIAIFCTIAATSEQITFSANSMTGRIGEKSDSTNLTGDAYVLTESMEISADSISMSGKDFRYIEANGNVKGKNMESQMEFSCGRMKYDRETKNAELFDDASMEDTKNEVSAKAQIIEYNQNTDIATLQFDVELKQKDNTCTGAYAIYRKADKMLELNGNSQIKQGDDTFRAQEITLNLDTQEITLDGRVKGTIVDERKSATSETDSQAENQNPQDESSTSNTQENPENLKEQNSSGIQDSNELQNSQIEEKDSPQNQQDSKNLQQNEQNNNSKKNTTKGGK